MYIAHSPDACEGEAHPLPDTDEKTSSDISPLTCDARNLPYQILRAHQRALSITSLPQRARCALAALAQTVDCRKPLSSIFARRGYLSSRAGLSERTWYRAEQDLIDAGLISVADQGRKTRGGLFGGAYIYLTREAATMLGLIAAVPNAGAQSAKPVEATATEVIDGGHAAEEAGHTPSSNSLAQPTANPADRFTYMNYLSPASSQKRQQGRLPEDVQPLVGLGFHENFVFKLMKLARVQHGKRLGDVVQACWEPLSKAKHPVSYLFALLASATDFGWLARQRKADDEARRERDQAATVEQGARARLAGQVLFSQSGATRYDVDSKGLVLTIHDAVKGETRTAVSGWIHGLVEAAARGAIVPATTDLVRQFSMRLAGARESASSALSAGRDTGLITQSIEACRAQLRAMRAARAIGA